MYSKIGQTVMFASTQHIERQRVYIVVSVVIVAVCVWLGLRAPIAFPLDDAYITLHNAAVLISGIDVNYPETPALVGATSSVHLAVVMGLSTFLPPLVASYTIGVFGMVLYALGLARLAFTFGGSSILAVITTAIGLLSGYTPYHLLNGLETGLAMAVATWALLFALSEKPSWCLPVLCGLIPFIRPEFAALSVLLMAHQARIRIRWPDAVPAMIRDVSIALLVALPWLLWARWNSGQFAPGTVSAKVAFFAEEGYPAAVKFFTVLRAVNIMTVTTAFLGFTLKPRNELGLIALGFLMVFLAAYYIHFPGVLHHNYYRYLQIMTPFSIFALLSNAREKPIAQYLLIFSAVFVAVTLPRSWSAYAEATEYTQRELAGVAQWANENLPPDARILIHDAGYLAYATRFQLVDLVGLKTPASVRFHQHWTVPSSGEKRDEAIHQIALQFRPTHTVILNDADKFWWKLADALREHGWILEKLRPATNVGAYAVFKLIPPR